VTQRVLPRSAIDEFDTPEGVAEQLQHFKSLLGFNVHSVFSVLDVGGGTGFFVSALKAEFPHGDATILDLDEASVIKGMNLGLTAIHGSIIEPPAAILSRKFDVISFNLVLHHIIGDTDSSTVDLQRRALCQACTLLTNGGRLFVHEICYEGRLVPDSSALLIYQISSSRRFSRALRFVGKISPALRSNTAGIGVRFRPASGWVSLAGTLGLQVIGACEGGPEGHSLLRKTLLLIREVRRCSLVLRPVNGKTL